MTADDVTGHRRPPADEPMLAGRCEWTGHGVSRREREGSGRHARASRSTGMRTRDEPATAFGDGFVQDQGPTATVVTPTPPGALVESTAAFDMVKEHCGKAYTVVWQGRGWTVEVSSGYPLWTVQG